MKQWRELPLCSIPIGEDRVIEVVVSSPDLQPFLLRRDARTGKHVAAYFDPLSFRIAICASNDMETILWYLFHELQHAAYYAAGATSGDFATYEETAVRKLTPELLPALEALGLKSPVIPLGFDALHAHAIYVRRRARKAA